MFFACCLERSQRCVHSSCAIALTSPSSLLSTGTTNCPCCCPCRHPYPRPCPPSLGLLGDSTACTVTVHSHVRRHSSLLTLTHVLTLTLVCKHVCKLTMRSRTRLYISTVLARALSHRFHSPRHPRPRAASRRPVKVRVRARGTTVQRAQSCALCCRSTIPT